MIDVMIIDDHPLVLGGLEVMLSARRIFRVVKTVSSGEEAIAYVRRLSAPPDVILTDIRMPGMDGFEVLAKIRRIHPSARVLMLAGMPLREEAEKARKMKAAGYMSKSADIDQLAQSIQEIAENPTFFAEDSFVPSPTLLSPRETDVLRLLAEGLQRDAIAARLGISSETVKSRIKTLMIKLDASNAVQAVHRAHELGILRA